MDPLAIGLTMEYVVKDEINLEKYTTWILGTLDSFTQSKLVASFIDISMEDGKPKLEKSKQSEHPDFAIVRYGLKGFKNFGSLEFKTEKISIFNQELEAVPDDILKLIPLDVIHELAKVIWDGNRVNEELKKN